MNQSLIHDGSLLVVGKFRHKLSDPKTKCLSLTIKKERIYINKSCISDTFIIKHFFYYFICIAFVYCCCRGRQSCVSISLNSKQCVELYNHLNRFHGIC